MEVGIRVTPFNARLRRARRRAGLTQAQVAAIMGVSQSQYSAIERLCRPVGEDEATQIALIFGCDVDYLFPLEARDLRASKCRSVEFVCETHSLAAAQQLALPSPEDEYICVETQEGLREAISGLLAGLPARQEKVIRLLFGLDGSKPLKLEEVGAVFGVSRERIRQVQAGAMRRLRHPMRTEKLEQWR